VDKDFRPPTTAAQVDFPLGTRVGARATVSHFEDSIDQNQSGDFLRTRRNAADVQFDWKAFAAHALSAGAMLSFEDARSESYGERMAADTHALNVFLQDRIAVGRHSGLFALGYTDHETAGDAVTWNAEYGWAIDPATRVYALTGAGFRAPDATDRYGFGGNPALKPERSHNYELGLRRTLGERQSVQLSAFRNDIDDLIEFVTLSYDPFAGENRNVARSRTQGVEASWTYTGGAWQSRVEAIYQDPRDLTTDTQLLRRAKESITFSLARTLGPVVLGLDVLATGERKDFGFPKPVTLDGYLLADLTARWQVTRSLALIGRVENLLDEQYELASTFNTPDRGVYLSMRYAPSRGQ
jgi:vitamin B12 transporter